VRRRGGSDDYYYYYYYYYYYHLPGHIMSHETCPILPFEYYIIPPGIEYYYSKG